MNKTNVNYLGQPVSTEQSMLPENKKIMIRLNKYFY